MLVGDWRRRRPPEPCPVDLDILDSNVVPWSPCRCSRRSPSRARTSFVQFLWRGLGNTHRDHYPEVLVVDTVTLPTHWSDATAPKVHFLDLERLHSWVIAPPPPSGQRGRVCTLTIESSILPPAPDDHPREEGETPPVEAMGKPVLASPGGQDLDPRHLVVVLETGAVFTVLLERGRPGVGGAGEGDTVETELGDKDSAGADGEVVGPPGDGSGGGARLEYARLGVETRENPEFAPSWVDVGRGASGGGGGGQGVRVMPAHRPVGRRVSGGAGKAAEPGVGLQVSIVSRTWGNKCSVKMLGVAASNEGHGMDWMGHGWDRERGHGRPQALRMEVARQVTLPVDHPNPEAQSMAVVSSGWAVLASHAAGSIPARVTVASLEDSERQAPSSVRFFPLPPGERVGGVGLLSMDHATGSLVVPTPRFPDPQESLGVAARATTWGLVWSDAGIYWIDFGEAGSRIPQAAPDPGTTVLPPPPRPAPPTPPPLPPLPPARSLGSSAPQGKSAGLVTVRRPPATAVRRARELYSLGYLSEAVKVGVAALDGGGAPGVSSSAGGGGLGAEEGGGGVTTRMVREDLANSLLEWLIALRLRGSDDVSPALQADSSASAPAASGSSPAPGTHGARGGTGGQEGFPPERRPRPAPGSTPQTRSSTRREGRQAASSRPPKRDGGGKGGEAGSPPPDPPAPEARSRLEHFLLTSLDYDPILAATLLHARGQADLAVVASAARGGAAIPGTIRVLAESSWPPRLGLRAVECLCRAGAAAELISAGGGTLFAALEPALRVRVLMSDHRILFRGSEGAAAGSGDSTAARESSASEGIGDEAGPSPDPGGLARRRVAPFFPALSVGEIAEVCARLARWCSAELLGAGASEEALSGGGETGGEGEGPSASPPSGPPPAARQAIEILLDALLELSARNPPPGLGHKYAWLEAGCVAETSCEEGVAAAGQKASVGAGYGSGGAKNPCTHEGPGSERMSWPKTAAALAGILEAHELSGDTRREGEAGAGGACEVEGGLPTAARRALLSALPLLHACYDPVVVMLKAVRAGCWAAVAMQLELLGRRRDAVSAKLHGVVSVLKVRVPPSRGFSRVSSEERIFLRLPGDCTR